MIEIESEILSGVIGCKSYHKHAPEYGSRAWKAEGKHIDVIYWDVGNGWCVIMDVIPKNGKNECVAEFYKKLQKVIRQCYDGSGFRIK